MFSWREFLLLFKFWGGDPNDLFLKIVRLILVVAYFSLAIGIALAGPTYNITEGWQDEIGMPLVTFGISTILFGHALLGYASYRKQPQFKSPDHASKNMVKNIFLFIYLPAIVLTILTVGLTLLLQK